MSDEFYRHWRTWFPYRFRARPKPTRTFEGCEQERGWHLWSGEVPGRGIQRSAETCSWCGLDALQVMAKREAKGERGTR